MSNAKTMKIAFHRGGKIPATIAKQDADVDLGPHEPVNVPADYGRHLVDDRFAYEVKGKAKAAPIDKRSPDIPTLEKAVADAQAVVNAATGDEAKAAAQAKLDEAQKALDEAKAG